LFFCGSAGVLRLAIEQLIEWIDMTPKVSFAILAMTALALSRGMLALFKDPEGPNLLIVAVFAAIALALSIAVNYVHARTVKVRGAGGLITAIAVQLAGLGGIYLLLR
jgi:hypothetical protein